jgi:hypothetical protein
MPARGGTRSNFPRASRSFRLSLPTGRQPRESPAFEKKRSSLFRGDDKISGVFFSVWETGHEAAHPFRLDF